MNNLFVPTFVAVTIIGSGMAFGAQVTGTIKMVDPTKHEVALTNGRTYSFEATSDLSKLTTGEKVKITYKLRKGNRQASAIVAQS
jgi:hypothetical protein